MDENIVSKKIIALYFYQRWQPPVKQAQLLKPFLVLAFSKTLMLGSKPPKVSQSFQNPETAKSWFQNCLANSSY